MLRQWGNHCRKNGGDASRGRRDGLGRPRFQGSYDNLSSEGLAVKVRKCSRWLLGLGQKFVKPSFHTPQDLILYFSLPPPFSVFPTIREKSCGMKVRTIRKIFFGVDPDRHQKNFPDFHKTNYSLLGQLSTPLSIFPMAVW